MTRPATANLDPLPEPDHRPASSAWARKAALDATRAAVEAARDKRKKPKETP
jgi:hypothetical protein